MSILQVNNLHKSFTETKALNGVIFEVNQTEILSILGPSGCGKSTILAIIAGLIEPDSGEVIWNGKQLQGIPTHKRGFGLMFQDYVLFPHMNVRENVAFVLKCQDFLENKSINE